MCVGVYGFVCVCACGFVWCVILCVCFGVCASDGRRISVYVCVGVCMCVIYVCGLCVLVCV